MEQTTETTEIASVPDSSIGAIMMNAPILAEVEKIATRMASAKCTIPNHLVGSEGDCYAVCLQAVQWGMNPYAVAQKTHVVSGTLGYEAQLVNAVITSLAPTKDRLHYEWYGDWTRVLGKFVKKKSQKGNEYMAPNWTPTDEEGLGVKVWATMKGEDEPRVLDLLLSQAQVRNSTLWASDPRQQLAYLGVKRWARLYCPDVILGVYSPDELSSEPAKEREVAPAQVDRNEPVPYPEADFAANLPKWQKVVEGGRKSPDDIIAMVESKGFLTDEQKDAIRNCAPLDVDTTTGEVLS